MKFFILFILAFSNEIKADNIERSFWIITYEKIVNYQIKEGDEKENQIVLNENPDAFKDLERYEERKGFVMPFLYEVKMIVEDDAKAMDTLDVAFLNEDNEAVYSITKKSTKKGKLSFFLFGENGNNVYHKTISFYMNTIPIQATIIGSIKKISSMLDVIVKYCSIIWLNDLIVKDFEKTDMDYLVMMTKFVCDNEVKKFDKGVSLCLNETFNVLMSLIEYTSMCIKDLSLEHEPFETDPRPNMSVKQRIYKESLSNFMYSIISENIKNNESVTSSLGWMLEDINEAFAKETLSNEPLDTSKIEIEEDPMDVVTFIYMKDTILSFSVLMLKAHYRKVVDLQDTLFKVVHTEIKYPHKTPDVDAESEEKEKNNTQESPDVGVKTEEKTPNVVVDLLPYNGVPKADEHKDDSEDPPINIGGVEYVHESEKKYFKRLFIACLSAEGFEENQKMLLDDEWSGRFKFTEIFFRLKDLQKGIENSIERVETLKKSTSKKNELFLLSFVIRELKKDLMKCKTIHYDLYRKKDSLHKRNITSLKEIIEKVLPNEMRSQKPSKYDSPDYKSKKKSEHNKKTKHKKSSIIIPIIHLLQSIAIFLLIYWLYKKGYFS